MIDPDSSEEHDEFEDQEDSDSLRDASELLTCGYYCITRDELQEGYDALLEARDLFDQLQHAEGSAESRLMLGLINYQQGEFKNALPLLASAQQQFAAMQSWYKQVATLYLLAHCHLGLEKPSKAVYTLKLAEKIFQERSSTYQNEQNSKFLPDWQTIQQQVEELLNKLNQTTSST